MKDETGVPAWRELAADPASGESDSTRTSWTPRRGCVVVLSVAGAGPEGLPALAVCGATRMRRACPTGDGSWPDSGKVTSPIFHHRSSLQSRLALPA